MADREAQKDNVEQRVKSDSEVLVFKQVIPQPAEDATSMAMSTEYLKVIPSKAVLRRTLKDNGSFIPNCLKPFVYNYGEPSEWDTDHEPPIPDDSPGYGEKENPKDQKK